MSNIILDSVYKAFGDKKALQNVSAEFEEGAVTCIMGRSGCGKTTLLNIIAGIYTQDSGSITGVPDAVSFVFQENRLCEDFTAVSNIRAVTGKALSKAAIEEHLCALGLANDLKKPVRGFSGGMKRRVSIARAICHPHSLLLLDEPFKGLDDDTRRMTADYILSHSAGVTVICVTHDEEDIELLHGRMIKL